MYTFSARQKPFLHPNLTRGTTVGRTLKVPSKQYKLSRLEIEQSPRLPIIQYRFDSITNVRLEFRFGRRRRKHYYNNGTVPMYNMHAPSVCKCIWKAVE